MFCEGVIESEAVTEYVECRVVQTVYPLTTHSKHQNITRVIIHSRKIQKQNKSEGSMKPISFVLLGPVKRPELEVQV